MARYLPECDTAVRRDPRSPETILTLLGACRDAGRYERVLEVTNVILSRQASARSATAIYDEAGDVMNWVFDERARALDALGRWDDAEREYRNATDQYERRGPNVSIERTSRTHACHVAGYASARAAWREDSNDRGALVPHMKGGKRLP